jgi:hypothetical protein
MVAKPKSPNFNKYLCFEEELKEKTKVMIKIDGRQKLKKEIENQKDSYFDLGFD